MPNNFKNNNENSIEDEIEKSLRAMVEEETNVAKAFVDNHAPVNKANSAAPVSKVNSTAQVDNGKTQVIPQIPKNVLNEEDDEIVFDYDYLDNDEPVKKVSSQNNNIKKTNPPKKKSKLDRNTRLAIYGIVAALIVVIIAIIIFAVTFNKKSKETYDYYYSKGMEYYNKDDYKNASELLAKAVKEKEGKKNLELKFTLYKCYNNLDDNENSISILKDILSYDDDYEDAISALALIYYMEQDGEALTKLIRTYEGTKSETLIEKYIVEDPTASEESGTYDDTVTLKLTCESGDIIYYTTDGSEPNQKSKLYDGTPLEITNGTTKIKAVAMNSIGVCSNVIELNFVVEYGAPSAPEVTPISGQYSKGEKVKITVPEKCKAYYTLDGTTPTKSSTEYTEEFEMPEGNTVVSVILINDHEQSSSVTKRNYVVAAQSTHTYESALDLLQKKLIEDKVLTSKDKTIDGLAVEFGYQTKTKVDDVEMIIIKFATKSTTKYYGVGVSTGKIYKVTESGGKYSATAY